MKNKGHVVFADTKQQVKKSHPQSVRQPESPPGQQADRPSDQQAGRLNEARVGVGGQKLGCADGNEHDAASKYR